MALERYKKLLYDKRVKSQPPPRVTIQTYQGRVSLNKPLVEMLGDWIKEAIQIFYDADCRKLMLKFVRREEDHDRVLSVVSHGKSAQFSALNVLDSWEIPHGDKSRRYPAHYDAAKRTVTIRLDEEIV